MEERRNNFGRIEGRARSKKLRARVDLTAMVSVSFLLIIFFMLTSYMSRPQAVDLGMPDKSDKIENGCCICISDDRTMTLLLGDNNRIISYKGNLDAPLEEPKEFNYNSNNLTRELIAENKSVQDIYGDSKRGLIVIVKPSKQSTYGNLVEVLDKLAIARTPTYAVVDISQEEEELLLRNK